MRRISKFCNSKQDSSLCEKLLEFHVDLKQHLFLPPLWRLPGQPANSSCTNLVWVSFSGFCDKQSPHLTLSCSHGIMSLRSHWFPVCVSGPSIFWPSDPIFIFQCYVIFPRWIALLLSQCINQKPRHHLSFKRVLVMLGQYSAQGYSLLTKNLHGCHNQVNYEMDSLCLVWGTKNFYLYFLKLYILHGLIFLVSVLYLNDKQNLNSKFWYWGRSEATVYFSPRL